jgi:hypothetical protein
VKTPIAVILLILALTACSSPVQPTPTVTFTPVPTSTPISTLTNTPLPPTETQDVLSALLPEGQPAPEWNGIPIMPGAITGEGDEEGYVFTIKATQEQIQEYYERELAILGWQPFATGDGDSSQMLIFMNDASETLSVSIISKRDEALVLLVK